MAFEDILQALGADTDAKIAAARAEHARALEGLRARSESSVGEKLAWIAGECERKKKNMERQVTAHAMMNGRQAAMSAKHDLMERAYASALDALVSLDASSTETLVARLLESCPAGGTIHPAEPHAALVKKLAKGREIGEHVSARGGFVFVSEHAERNCTYEFLVREILRPATELSVAATLFPSSAA